MLNQSVPVVNPLLRRPTVSKLRGESRTTTYRKIKRKLLTSPIQIGGGRVAWPQDEIAALNQALISGKTEDEIRQLVLELEAARTTQ